MHSKLKNKIIQVNVMFGFINFTLISCEQTLKKCCYKIIYSFSILAYIDATHRIWYFPRQNKGRVKKEVVAVEKTVKRVI